MSIFFICMCAYLIGLRNRSTLFNDRIDQLQNTQGVLGYSLKWEGEAQPLGNGPAVFGFVCFLFVFCFFFRFANPSTLSFFPSMNPIDFKGSVDLF